MNLRLVAAGVGRRVAALPDSGVARDRVVFRPGRFGFVDGTVEVNFEAVRGGSNFADAVGKFSVGPQPDNAPRVEPSEPAAVVDAADVDVSVGSRRHAERPEKRLVQVPLRLREIINRSLQITVDFVIREPDEQFLFVLSPDAVPGERFDFVVFGKNLNAVDAAGPRMRYLHGGRMMVDFEVAIVVVRHAEVQSFAQVVDLVEAVLNALIVAGKQTVLAVDRQAGWISERRGKRRHDSFGRHLHDTAAPQTEFLRPPWLAVIAAQPDIHVALRIANNAARPVVVVVVEAPAGCEDGPLIGTAVAVGVAKASHLRFLRDDDRVAVFDDSVRSRETFLKQLQRILQPVAVGVFREVDVPLQRRVRQRAVLENGHCRRHDRTGQRQRDSVEARHRIHRRGLRIGVRLEVHRQRCRDQIAGVAEHAASLAALAADSRQPPAKRLAVLFCG